MLSVLVEDGRISITDLARNAGLSKTPCQVRLRRLIGTREATLEELTRAYAAFRKQRNAT